jgi:cytidyltransferase-like protein
VIVASSELYTLRGMVTMVDGGFDPLHAGHVDLFECAAGYGLPVLCNVSGDDYVKTKHPPLLPAHQRVRIIDAIRFIDYVHLSSDSTASVIELVAPRRFVKGADWKGRLPEDETSTCRRVGTDIVFADTVSDSSTRILREYGRAAGSWDGP